LTSKPWWVSAETSASASKRLELITSTFGGAVFTDLETLDPSLYAGCRFRPCSLRPSRRPTRAADHSIIRLAGSNISRRVFRSKSACARCRYVLDERNVNACVNRVRTDLVTRM